MSEISGDTSDTSSPDTAVDPAAEALKSLFSKQAEDGDVEAPKETEDTGDTEQAKTPDVDDTKPDSEAAKPEPRKLKVKIDGVESEVTEEEAAAAYQRHADYTRKTQELAEKRKSFDAEDAAVREERQRIADAITRYEAALKEATPPEPDWDKIRTDNPAEFPALWATWDQHKKRLASVAEERNAAVAKVQRDQERHRTEFVAAEQAKLLEAIPAWKDSAVESKEKGELAEYAKSMGFTNEDLKDITDHRVLVFLRKALQFDKAEQAKPAAQAKIEKVVVATPGPSAPAAAQESGKQKARQQLAKSGSISDAAAAMEHLL